MGTRDPQEPHVSSYLHLPTLSVNRIISWHLVIICAHSVPTREALDAESQADSRQNPQISAT